MVQVDCSTYDPASVTSGGRPGPGKAHLLIEDVEDRGDTVALTLAVLAHTNKADQGKTLYSYFQLSGKGARRIVLLALAVGLVTQEELDTASQQNAQSLDLPIDETIIGRTFCSELIEEEYDGKWKTKIAFDFHPPGTEGYPVDKTFLGGSGPPRGRSGGHSSPPVGDDDAPF